MSNPKTEIQKAAETLSGMCLDFLCNKIDESAFRMNLCLFSERYGKNFDESEKIEPSIEIDGKLVTASEAYLSPVTYVPKHAKGNCSHKDCQLGVIMSFDEYGVFVLYNKSRTVQKTNTDDLVWG